MHRFGHHWMHGPHWEGGFFWGPGMLFTLLSILFWIALMVGLIWAIVAWLWPSIKPILKDIFGATYTDVSALEILRRRYAAGEIDSVTFEQMWERLMASYQQEGLGVPCEGRYQEESWIGYRNT